VAGRRVTLADVARAAAVSSTTASLVLSGRGGELRISEAVQDRVRSAAAELGYRPNIVSRGLRQGSSRSIGLVSDTVATSQLAGDMIKGAIDEARTADYTLIIGETEGDPAVERRLLESMHDRQVDGILLASMYTRTREVPEALDDVPTVLLNTLPAGDGLHLPAVVPDELEAGRAAARLLLETGHRAIHLIGAGPGPRDVPPGTVAGDERLAGILEVLGAAGVAAASGRVCYEWLPPDGYRATRAILERAGSYDPGTALAILTFNDRLAFGAYQAIQEAGLRVPDDVSVVSFDDAPLAAWLRPGLTTFALPHDELGRRAVRMLLGLIDARGPAGDQGGGPGGDTVVRLPMPLVTRGSVRGR
jgi:LacI family transcriptional regulator